MNAGHEEIGIKLSTLDVGAEPVDGHVGKSGTAFRRQTESHGFGAEPGLTPYTNALDRAVGIVARLRVMAPRKAEPRAWQRMLSGRRLDLLDPTPVDIEIEDIAHGLAFVARWNGQTKGEYPYSVAEHSLLVETLFTRLVPRAPAKWRLAALLHDAPEYVIGDMIAPVKSSVGPGYSALDDRLTAAIHLRFGLPAAVPRTVKSKIKRADKMSAWFEATRIAGFAESEANKFFGRPDMSLVKGLSILLRPPIESRVAFVERHNTLLAEMG